MVCAKDEHTARSASAEDSGVSNSPQAEAVDFHADRTVIRFHSHTLACRDNGDSATREASPPADLRGMTEYASAFSRCDSYGTNIARHNAQTGGRQRLRYARGAVDSSESFATWGFFVGNNRSWNRTARYFSYTCIQKAEVEAFLWTTEHLSTECEEISLRGTEARAISCKEVEPLSPHTVAQLLVTNNVHR